MSKGGPVPYPPEPLVTIRPGMGCAQAFVILVAGLGVSACAPATGAARPAAFPAPPARPVQERPASTGGSASVGEALMQTAVAFQGIPYRAGGDSPDRGFDCSGFVRYVFGVNHITLPRTVLEQSVRGQRISPRLVQPGDLLFFATGTRGVSHVGIAIGGGQFVHAPSNSGVVRVDRVLTPYWKERFLEARRVTAGA
jgi:cell wall-associated NlpC family hydrolase